MEELESAVQADRDAGATGLHEYVTFCGGKPCGWQVIFHGPNKPADITPDMLPAVRRLVPLDGIEPFRVLVTGGG